MGVNVIQLRPSVQKNKKVSLLPNCFVFLLKMYKQKQDEIRNKKIDFLTQEATQYYYDLLETPKLAEVDIPAFIYEKQRIQYAEELASMRVLEVIKNGRINECYKARIAELRKKGRK
jgi:hypothetical protein